MLLDTLPGTSAEGGGADAAGAGAVMVSEALRPALRVGRYLLLRQVGTGGMGVVFAAYDEELDRKVAVKLLREAGDVRSELRTRILREAQAMARISHPNVVQIYEAGELAAVAGQVFIAMEFIEGATLADWQRTRSWEEVLPVYLSAGEGLRAAHDSGLVHRDFKPDNVLIGSDGRPRVADFGLARPKPSEASEASESGPAPAPLRPVDPGAAKVSGSLLVTPLTQAGTILGTPAYMSPEQYRGEPTDSRSDQFSFCVALYEALYRTLPFAGLTLAELRANVLAGKILPPPLRTAVPPTLHTVLRRGLSTDPGQRFPSMRELLAALAFDPQRDPGAAPRSRRIFSRMLLAVMLVVLAVMFPTLRRGGVTPAHGLVASSMFLICGALAAFVLRKTLLRNAFHRGTMFCMLVFILEQLGMRAVGALAGVTPQKVMPLELICMAGTGATLSYFFFPTAWGLIPLLLGAALWAALRPQDAEMLTVVVFPTCIFAMVFLWERAARVRERAPAGKGAPSP